MPAFIEDLARTYLTFLTVHPSRTPTAATAQAKGTHTTEIRTEPAMRPTAFNMIAFVIVFALVQAGLIAIGYALLT